MDKKHLDSLEGHRNDVDYLFLKSEEGDRERICLDEVSGHFEHISGEADRRRRGRALRRPVSGTLAEERRTPTTFSDTSKTFPAEEIGAGESDRFSARHWDFGDTVEPRFENHRAFLFCVFVLRATNTNMFNLSESQTSP